MKRIGRVFTVEHDLAAGEAAPPRDRQQQPHFFLGQVLQEAPPHLTTLSHERDISSVKTGNGAGPRHS
jgi:hypothetical protein